MPYSFASLHRLYQQLYLCVVYKTPAIIRQKRRASQVKWKLVRMRRDIDAALSAWISINVLQDIPYPRPQISRGRIHSCLCGLQMPYRQRRVNDPTPTESAGRSMTRTQGKFFVAGDSSVFVVQPSCVLYVRTFTPLHYNCIRVIMEFYINKSRAYCTIII